MHSTHSTYPPTAINQSNRSGHRFSPLPPNGSPIRARSIYPLKAKVKQARFESYTDKVTFPCREAAVSQRRSFIYTSPQTPNAPPHTNSYKTKRKITSPAPPFLSYCKCVRCRLEKVVRFVSRDFGSLVRTRGENKRIGVQLGNVGSIKVPVKRKRRKIGYVFR